MTADLDARTTAALLSLDPAAAPLTGAQVARSVTTLTHILASDPGLAPAAERVLPETARRRRTRRVLLTAGTAVAVSVGMVVVQGVTAGDPAFASWTAGPAPVLSADAVEIGEVCRAFLGGPDGFELPPPLSPVDQDNVVTQEDVDAARVLVAERRGEWQFVLMGGPDGFEGTCLLQAPGLLTRIFGGDHGDGFGSLGKIDVPGPLAQTIAVTDKGGGASDAGSFQQVTGLVGTDVRAVTVAVGGRQVVASVAGGRFAAWWPAPPFGSEGDAYLDHIPDGYTVTLADGTVLENVPIADVDPG